MPSLGSSAWFLCRAEESPAWTLEVVWPAASVLFWGLQPVSRLSRPAIHSGKYSVPQSPRDCWHKADRAPSPAPSLCSKVGRMPELSSAICCYCTLLCSTLLCSSLGGSSRCAGLANALDRPCTSSRGCQRALKQVATPLSGSGLGCLDEGPGKEPLLQATARPRSSEARAHPPVQVGLVVRLQRWTGPSLCLRTRGPGPVTGGLRGASLGVGLAASAWRSERPAARQLQRSALSPEQTVPVLVWILHSRTPLMFSLGMHQVTSASGRWGHMPRSETVDAMCWVQRSATVAHPMSGEKYPLVLST